MSGLETLGADATLVAEGEGEGEGEGEASRRSRAEPLARGATLGRYLVLERVGAGGMGEVYAAYDPELDRKVAIKLLHAESSATSTSTDGASRLLREAQAMARLHDPHVITVHDVGTLDGRVFVAMEFVEGSTFGEWIEREKPEWPEALAVLLDAGRGLAAAHRAGLIHRDFKPDNVLLGNDGRVLVADFGLARAIGATIPEPRAALDPSAIVESTSTLEVQMTATGAVMGTPAYMSPEAHLGAEVDASSDQFSFCVAAYEALYGERPYRGDTLAALAFQIFQGQIREPPAGTKVPSWLRRVIVRGLAREPGDRYPTMDALLAALARDVGRERRRLGMFAGVAIALAGGLTAAYALLEDEPAPDPTAACVAADEQLVGVWDPARKLELKAAIEGTGIAYAPQTWRALEATLDAYTDAWLAAHRQACQATHVEQRQSTRVLDLQVACLDDRLRELRSLLGLLDEPDRELLANVEGMATQLPRIERCADTEALLARVAPPEDASLRAEVEALRGAIANAKAARKAQRLDRARALVEPLVARAEALGYAPVEAEVLYERGRLREAADQPDEAEDDLSRALATGIASGHDELVVQAATVLVGMMVVRQHRLREADHWQRIAEGALEHLGGDDLLESELLCKVARGLAERGEFDASLAAAERAVALREAVRGRDHIDTVEPLQVLARAHYQRQAIGEMLTIQAHVVELLEAHYGPDHPALATSLNNLAVAHLLQDEHERAAELLERVVAMRDEYLGPDHILTIDARSNLGITQIKLGEYEAAEANLRAVLDTYAERYGSDNPDTGEAHVNLASAIDPRDLDAATEHVLRALAIFEAAEDGHGPRTANALHRLIHYAQQREDWAGSVEIAARAGPMYLEAYGADSLSTIEVELDVAIAELGLGKASRAKQRLDTIVPVIVARAEPLSKARAEFALGRALVALGEREAGRAMVESALGRLEGEDTIDARELRASIEAWL